MSVDRAWNWVGVVAAILIAAGIIVTICTWAVMAYLATQVATDPGAAASFVGSIAGEMAGEAVQGFKEAIK